MKKDIETIETSGVTVDLGRRKALSRLSLSVATAILVTLSQSAYAAGGGSGGSGGGGGGGGFGGSDLGSDSGSTEIFGSDGIKPQPADP